VSQLIAAEKEREREREMTMLHRARVTESLWVSRTRDVAVNNINLPALGVIPEDRPGRGASRRYAFEQMFDQSLPT